MYRTIAAALLAAAIPQAGAVNIADDGVGQVAIAPYYTVRDNWQTLFTMTNTQSDPIVVKVRFREALNSRPTLDFLVALAGFDTFTGAVRESRDGSGPVFVGADSPNENGEITCTIPSDIVLNRQLERLVNLEATGIADLNGLVVNNVDFGEDALLVGNILNNVFMDGIRNTDGVPLSADAYTGTDALGSNADGGPEGIDRLREGYIEFIVLGYAELPDFLLQDPVGVPARPLPSFLDQTVGDLLDTLTDGFVTTNPNDIVSSISEVPLGTINVAAAIEQHNCGLLDYAFYDYDNPLTPSVDQNELLASDGGGALQGLLDLLSGAPLLQFRPSFVLETARQMGAPPNALKVNFSLLNPQRGVEASSDAIAWANFYNPEPRPEVLDPEERTAEDEIRVTPRQNRECTITRGDERTPPPTEEGLVPTLLSSVGGLLFCPDGSLNLLSLRDCEVLEADWQPSASPESCLNLITAQPPLEEAPPPLLAVLTGSPQLGALQVGLLGESGAQTNAFLEPSLNDAFPQRANWLDDERNEPLSVRPARSTGLPAPSDLRGVDAFSLTIQNASVNNELSVNPNLGVETNWILTLPTKGFYVDAGLPGADPGHRVALLPGERDEALLADAVGTRIEPPYAPFAQRFVGESCNTATTRIFDRAGQSVEPEGDGVIPSPAPPVTREVVPLCGEVNVVTFNGQSALLSPARPADVTFDPANFSGNRSGWMFMNLDDAFVANADNVQGGLAGFRILGNGEETFVRYGGLPVVGFLLKQRTFGSAGRNFASTADHAYARRTGP
jgi:hypothetical protein